MLIIHIVTTFVFITMVTIIHVVTTVLVVTVVKIVSKSFIFSKRDNNFNISSIIITCISDI